MKYLILKTDDTTDPFFDALISQGGDQHLDDSTVELQHEDLNIMILGVITNRNYPKLIRKIGKLDDAKGSIFFPNQIMPPNVAKEFATCTGRKVIFNQNNTQSTYAIDDEKFIFRGAKNSFGRPLPFLCALPNANALQEMDTAHEVYYDSGFGQYADIEEEKEKQVWDTMLTPIISSTIQTPTTDPDKSTRDQPKPLHYPTMQSTYS